MEKQLSEKEIKAIARQLKHPKGTKGIEVGEMMHTGNIGMTRAAINSLQLSNNEKVLEIGHGNGAHLPELFKKAKNLRYFGLDISNLMHEQAKKINAISVGSNTASFHLYDGEQFPFAKSSFDKIMTINTIYFWENPQALLNEVYRVLKNSGVFSLAFGQKDFMKNLPFTQHGFTLYNTEDVEFIVYKTNFKILKINDLNEIVKSKTKAWVERNFTVVTLGK